MVPAQPWDTWDQEGRGEVLAEHLLQKDKKPTKVPEQEEHQIRGLLARIILCLQHLHVH